MFTIKHVSVSGGETLYSTDEVTYSPQQGSYVGSQLAGRVYSPATVWYRDAKDLKPLTGGTAYVMNDNGATVSKYDLGIDYGMPSDHSYDLSNLTASEAAAMQGANPGFGSVIGGLSQGAVGVSRG